MRKAIKHASILGGLTLEGVAPAKAAETARVEQSITAKPAKGETEMFRTTIHMNRKVHDVLREIAYTERTTITALINEGLDSVLKARHHPSTGEISGKA